MKKANLWIPLVLGIFSVTTTSCTGNSEEQVPEKPKSTNVDSTNVYGTPPVQYGHDNPADTTQRFPADDDTGRRANTEER